MCLPFPCPPACRPLLPLTPRPFPPFPQGEDVSENARFYLYLDEDWDGVMEAETCGEKAAMAKWASSSLRGQFHPLRHTVTQVCIYLLFLFRLLWWWRG